MQRPEMVLHPFDRQVQSTRVDGAPIYPLGYEGRRASEIVDRTQSVSGFIRRYPILVGEPPVQRVTTEAVRHASPFWLP